jgi:hypothetical protein
MSDKFVSCALLAVVCCCLQAAEPKRTPRERFLALNPNYDKGVAELYRRDYLPSAASSMTTVIDDKAFKEEDAQRVLGTLIDDFLRKFVDGGGTITRLERGRLMQAMDKSVKQIVKNEDAFARYTKWRDTTDRKANALFFLMTEAELKFSLPKALRDAGWTMKSQGIDDLEKFAGYFGEGPDYVFVFENPTLSKEGKRASLTVLAFQAERVRDKVLDREGPFRSTDEKLPAIDYFWQAGGFAFFSSEGDLTAPQARLASTIRSQMVGQPRFEARAVPID